MSADTATSRMVRGIYGAIEQGFDEAGLPLTTEQRAFLADSLVSLDPMAEAFS